MREEIRGAVMMVARSAEHRFSKQVVPAITLIAGVGVDGDAHAGATVKHRSRVRADPTQPNLRQVHLVHAELLEELAAKGFKISPGDIGENITTSGIDLLALPRGARLRLGTEATIEVTGLRNPCFQLDSFRPGLMHAVLDRDEEGRLVLKAGIMAVVLVSGEVKPGDAIAVELPPPPYSKLERV